MEFWGAEVKHGETLKVSLGDGKVLHLSQANVGELKKGKGNESVCLFLTVDGKKLVLGTIYTEKIPQQQFELVFEKDFELSHNWKSGSVFFYGYKADNGVHEELLHHPMENLIPLNRRRIFHLSLEIVEIASQRSRIRNLLKLPKRRSLMLASKNCCLMIFYLEVVMMTLRLSMNPTLRMRMTLMLNLMTVKKRLQRRLKQARNGR